MTTLIAIESPRQVDFLATLGTDHVQDEEQTYVVHAPERSDECKDWADCRHECTARGEAWEFRLIRGDGPPAERLVAFAGNCGVDQIALIAPDRTATGKIAIGSTAREILLSDVVHGEVTINGDFLFLHDLTYS